METEKAIEILKRILQGNMEYDLAIRTAIEIMETYNEWEKRGLIEGDGNECT